MTDYSISDGAVDDVQRWSWETHTFPPLGWGPVEGMIRRALRYYAEHPEELPQEVRDAVRGMGNG